MSEFILPPFDPLTFDLNLTLYQSEGILLEITQLFDSFLVFISLLLVIQIVMMFFLSYSVIRKILRFRS